MKSAIVITAGLGEGGGSAVEVVGVAGADDMNISMIKSNWIDAATIKKFRTGDFKSILCVQIISCYAEFFVV